MARAKGGAGRTTRLSMVQPMLASWTVSDRQAAPRLLMALPCYDASDLRGPATDPVGIQLFGDSRAAFVPHSTPWRRRSARAHSRITLGLMRFRRSTAAPTGPGRRLWLPVRRRRSRRLGPRDGRDT